MDPLVSIIVITYNSSEYVLETLESAKDQTYENIELIVSDDCSTDNTVNVCKEWINGNRIFFQRVELINSRKNTGIPANCNRGINASKGEWIKLIAGDDLLDKSLLFSQIEYIDKHSEIHALWTNVATFHDTEKGRVFNIPEGISELSINRDEITPQQQFQIMLRQNPVFAGSLIIKRDVFRQIGLFDESYPSFEDLPFLHKLLLNHYKLHYLNIVGAYYRKHSKSVQLNNNDQLRNSYHTDVYRYEIKMLKHFNNILERAIRLIDAGYNLFYIRYISNKKNSINKILLYSPSFLLRQIIKTFSIKYN